VSRFVDAEDLRNLHSNLTFFLTATGLTGAYDSTPCASRLSGKTRLRIQ